jgi:hypothetical protein
MSCVSCFYYIAVEKNVRGTRDSNPFENPKTGNEGRGDYIKCCVSPHLLMNGSLFLLNFSKSRCT